MGKNLDIDRATIVVICFLLTVLTMASIIIAIYIEKIADYFINYVGLG